MTEKSLKLHLGCGERYLEGYLNIDLPSENQPVIKAKADLHADIRSLVYPENSVDEIRNHHLFEHFTRQEALKLLLQWRRWLKHGGLLWIETPDFETAAKRFVKAGLKEKFKIGRHLFGSHEADWAIHRDWWGEEKFRFVLTKFGFERIQFKKIVYFTSARFPDRAVKFIKFLPGLADRLDNIEVKAVKSTKKINEYEVVREILSMSLIGKEKEILEVWLKQIFE
ncbi:MAG: methyltransferase domain-containing protein [Patescibacteria group bacterium]